VNTIGVNRTRQGREDTKATAFDVVDLCVLMDDRLGMKCWTSPLMELT